MTAVLYVLLGWLLTVSTAISLGYWVERGIGLKTTGWTSLLYRFYLGTAALSLVVMGLCSAGLVYKGTVYGVAVAANLSALRQWPKFTLPKWHWSGVLFGLYVLLYLSHAMAPEHSPDGMSYHLGLVARYYREHGFVWFTTNMYAFLSQGLEMLFLFAYSVGRHSAAAMVHFTFLLSLPALLAVSYGMRGWLAGLTVFLLPVVGIDGISAYNDVALAVIYFATFEAVCKGEKEWVSAAAILAGFAFAIKFTGCIAVLLLLPAWREWPRFAWVAVSVVPWLVKSYMWSGNPVAPFFNGLFPNPWFNTEFENGYRSFLRHYDLGSWQEWAREVFVGGPRLSGTLGPVGLLLGLALLGVRKQKALIAAALLALAVYPLNVGTRFLIPVLPLLAVALFESLPRLSVVVPVVAAVLSWPSVLPLYASPYTWFLEKAPWRAALRIETEDGFLTRKSGGYVTARAIEQFVPAGESVFTLSPIPESYTSRNVLVAYQSTIGQKLQHALTAPTYGDYKAKFVYRCAGPQLQVTKDSKDTWSISEISPKPERMECNRTQWDQRLAMDGNPTTRWRTWGPAKRGDRCVLEPARPYVLFGSGDQWEVEIAGCTRTVEESKADYREAARRLFLAEGVRYMAVDAPDYPAKDMKENAALWPIELIAERGTMRIYRWANSNNIKE